MNFTANTDEKLLTLYNTLTLLQLKQNQGYNLYADATNSVRTDLLPIPNIWFTHNSFVKTYNKILKEYYTETKTAKKETIKKYYNDVYEPEKIGDKVYKPSILRQIRLGGYEDTSVLSYEHYSYTYAGCKADYTEINNVTAEIISERGKFFKNKKKINELVEKHKELRKQLSKPVSNLPKSATDRVFLKTFDTKSNDKIKYDITRYLFMAHVGYINLPAYFFSDCLYDLKNKDYLKFNTRCTIKLVPEAAIAYIIRDLEAENNSTTFFKKGVTEADVLKNVKKQAEYEKNFVEKFNLEFICNLFNEKLKAKENTKSTEQPLLTVKLPYMGLDKLNEEDLTEVASTIYNYYLIYENYNSYAYYYSKPSTDPNSIENLVASLPKGANDIKYISHYLGAINSGKYSTYYEVCAYVDNIRKQDELNARIKNIENNQKNIINQNNTIISNQNRLYEQKEKHHKEMISAQKATTDALNSVYGKLDDIDRKISSADVVIYY